MILILVNLFKDFKFKMLKVTIVNAGNINIKWWVSDIGLTKRMQGSKD